MKYVYPAIKTNGIVSLVKCNTRKWKINFHTNPSVSEEGLAL